MTDLHVPGYTGSNPCSPSCGVIVDSGTSLLAVPPSAAGIVRALENIVKPDCSNLDALPSISMKLGDVQIFLPGSSYVMMVKQEASSNGSLWDHLSSQARET